MIDIYSFSNLNVGMVKVLNVALVGLGTIGSGVVEILLNNSKLIEKRTGVKIILKYVCDINDKRAKELGVEKILVTDYKKILADKEINAVIELIGGYEPARTIISDSISAGKHVVTANKAVIAKHGYELFALAQENKVNILFEASVCGCIPIIRTIEESYSSDNIQSIYGIVNGTTNFILTKMSEGMSYAEALAKAQALGFAERDPSFDVEGKDAAQKLFILASLAFDANFSSEPFTCGITKLTKNDLDYAKDFGYAVKLLAIAKKSEKGVEFRVHPAMVSKSHVFANVSNEVNAVLLSGKNVGEIFLSGKGAGKLPTATVVVTDIIELGSRVRIAQRSFEQVEVIPFSQTLSRYFLRFNVLDEPGVLAAISSVLGEEGVSLSAVEQKECVNGNKSIVPIVMLTHKTKEENIARAITKCNSLAQVKEEVVMIRVEDFS